MSDSHNEITRCSLVLASLVSGKIIHKKTRNFDRTAQNIYANFSINLWNLYRTCPQGWSYKAKNDPKVKLSPFPSARLRKYIWDACAEMISNQACMWWTFDVLINPDPRVLIYQRSFYNYFAREIYFAHFILGRRTRNFCVIVLLNFTIDQIMMKW